MELEGKRTGQLANAALLIVTLASAAFSIEGAAQRPLNPDQPNFDPPPATSVYVRPPIPDLAQLQEQKSSEPTVERTTKDAEVNTKQEKFENQTVKKDAPTVNKSDGEKGSPEESKSIYIAIGSFLAVCALLMKKPIEQIGEMLWEAMPEMAKSMLTATKGVNLIKTKDSKSKFPYAEILYGPQIKESLEIVGNAKEYSKASLSEKNHVIEIVGSGTHPYLLTEVLLEKCQFKSALVIDASSMESTEPAALAAALRSALGRARGAFGLPLPKFLRTLVHKVSHASPAIIIKGTDEIYKDLHKVEKLTQAIAKFQHNPEFSGVMFVINEKKQNGTLQDVVTKSINVFDDKSEDTRAKLVRHFLQHDKGYDFLSAEKKEVFVQFLAKFDLPFGKYAGVMSNIRKALKEDFNSINEVSDRELKSTIFTALSDHISNSELLGQVTDKFSHSLNHALVAHFCKLEVILLHETRHPREVGVWHAMVNPEIRTIGDILKEILITSAPSLLHGGRKGVENVGNFEDDNDHIICLLKELLETHGGPAYSYAREENDVERAGLKFEELCKTVMPAVEKTINAIFKTADPSYAYIEKFTERLNKKGEILIGEEFTQAVNAIFKDENIKKIDSIITDFTHQMATYVQGMELSRKNAA